MSETVLVTGISGFVAEQVALMKKFVPMVKTIRAEVGIRSIARTDYVTELTGVSFRPSREALLATAESLLATHHLGE